MANFNEINADAKSFVDKYVRAYWPVWALAAAVLVIGFVRGLFA
jgi:hypothetical protein